MRIDTKSSVEQHASWLASNPVVGCPMNCGYCFLRPEGLTGVTPRVLFSPSEALRDLLSSVFYTEEIPVATGTRTDYFSTPANIAYLREYVSLYNAMGTPNPLVIITKKRIPNEMVELFAELEQKGTTFVFFLSYSGIDGTIEKGIIREEVRENFLRLHERGLRIVHYWRPFIPENSKETVMNAVLGHAMKYAKASITTGLKLTPEMKSQFWFWKEIEGLDIDLSTVEGVWPEGVEADLSALREKFPEYPIGYASSCAIAQALGIPDYNGFCTGEVCKNNSCPPAQRSLCEKFFRNNVVTEEMLRSAFARLGIPAENYEMDNDKKMLTLYGALDHSKIVNLTQTLRIRVNVRERPDDQYGWGSSVAERKPFNF